MKSFLIPIVRIKLFVNEVNMLSTGEEARNREKIGSNCDNSDRTASMKILRGGRREEESQKE